MNGARFDVGRWQGVLLSAPASFRGLASLAQLPEAAAAYKKSMRFQQADAHGSLREAAPNLSVT